jgi:hypothetical integral membrane protein (TIGR02206 family)
MVVSRVLACIVVLAEPSYWIRHAVNHTWSAGVDLPFQLSNAAEFVAAAALWWRTPFLVELTYFWGFSAVIQALLTPDLRERFPDPAYFSFYVGHGGVIVAALFLTLGHRITPRPGAPLRVFLASLAFTVVAAAANLVTNGNYMYLRQKPVAGSLLNFMGPWPWYVGTALILAVVFLALLNAPFWIARRRASAIPSPADPR